MIYLLTMFFFPDCCIVAEGDCPCNKYKPHIEPLVSCPPPPPKPPKKCKKPKRVECFCEEIDPRYASQCRHKRSIESGENISSIEITNDSSDENDSIIQELPVVACDLENVEKPDNSSQKIDEIGEGNVVSVQVNETKKNKKIEFKLGLKYYVSDPIEYLEDGESKIVYDYLGHKYIEKDGRLQIVKPAFYLEEEVISAEITIEPKSPEANCTEVKDLNTQNVTITVHKANDPTVAKTVNKEVDAIDDLSKNLGSILSLLVQDKHTDLADALGDVLMGMAELEDMKTTLEKDLINKKSKVVRPIEVMKPMEKLPSPIESRPPIPVERLSLPITNRMPAPLDRLPPPLDRLPAQNSNNFPTALDKIPLPIEKIPIPPQRWIQPTENKPSLPVDVLPSPTEKKPQLPSPFMKKLNNDPLQASLLQTGAGLRENLQAQPVDRIQSGLLQNGANLQPQPVDLMQSGLLKNGAGLRENIQVQPIDMRKPIFSDVFNPIVQQHKEIEKIQNKFTDTPKIVSPANEITPEDNVIKNNINTLNKNFIPFNKEFHPGKLLDFNMKNMDSMPKQLSDVQKVQYSPGNSIDNRFQSFKPTNFVQFQQPQQRYQPKPFLTNNFEEQLQD